MICCKGLHEGLHEVGLLDVQMFTGLCFFRVLDYSKPHKVGNRVKGQIVLGFPIHYS